MEKPNGEYYIVEPSIRGKPTLDSFLSAFARDERREIVALNLIDGDGQAVPRERYDPRFLELVSWFENPHYSTN